jgi:hypothetical protein
MTSEPLLPLDLPQTELSRPIPTPVANPSNGSPESFLRRKGRKENGAITDLGAWVRLTSSAVASPAKTSASPVRARELMARAAAYGRSTPELLAKFDRVSSSWRTSQLCLDGALQEFLETWPRSGLVVSGIVFRPVRLAHHIDETESGS